MIFALAFLFGSVIGSFLNVCIHRIPIGESIVFPPSRCPHCRTPIRPIDNIPIVSYTLLLRGRCRSCAAPISLRYPLVEAFTGVVGVAVVWRFGVSIEALVAFVFVAALIVVTFIDFDHQIIPDVISLPGIVIGLLLSLVLDRPGVKSALLGAALGYGVLYAVATGYYWLRKEEGMGGGDLKLLAMVGAFLGWKAVPLTLLLGSLTGSVVGISLMLLHGRDSRVPIPFGPFLAAGATCALFFGDALIDWYLRFAAGV
ncbi:MAG TPA: prepilin peptidase [Candidatus Kryptonia bacterium]|nr:prepilin peptidase [Candidatus Kryptonia bacterium]